MSCKDKIPMTSEEEKSFNQSIFSTLCNGLDIVNKRKQDMNYPQSIKFIDIESEDPPEYLPDEFDATFRYNDGHSVELGYGACAITIYDASAIEKTKDLKFGDLVRLKVR